MSVFNGIINNNGWETKIRLYLDTTIPIPYITDLFIGDAITDAYINYDTCTLQNTQYEYCVKIYENEILIVGKEIGNFFHCLLPCFYRQKYFVMTNKEEV